MTPGPVPATLAFDDSLAFYRELDRLVVRRCPVVIVVAVPPERDSALYMRIRRCQTPEAQAELGAFRQSESWLSRPGVLIRLFHWLYRRPNYFAYEAVVRKDLDPLEVHLRPLN